MSVDWIPRTTQPSLARKLVRASARHRKLLRLSLTLREFYLQLHDFTNLTGLLRTETHPFESYLDLIEQPELLANALSVVIPPNQDYGYLLDNILDYRWCLNLPSPEDDQLLLSRALTGRELTLLLRRYTDQRLFELLQIYIPYESRRQLIDRLASLLSGEVSFFMPLVRRCTNSQTYLGESTANTDLFMVAYGDYFDYRCYEEQEFLMNFRKAGDNFLFNLPGEELEREQVQVLLDIANIYGVTALVHRIMEGFARFDVVVELKVKTGQWTQEERTLFEKLLMTIFTTGMYMRRWRGVGPYPLHESETRGPFDPQLLASIGLTEIRQLREQIPQHITRLVEKLPAKRYLRGKLEAREETLMSMIDTVSIGKYCIREASNYFVSSAYHYLLEFLDQRISDFDPHKLSNIA